MKKSKGMQLGAMLVAMLLVSLAFVPAITALGTGQNSDIVSEAEAREVAEIFVQKISAQEITDWKNATVSTLTEYYNLDEMLTAYSFAVSKDGTYLGYLVVSADKNNYPVLEFSKGKSPDKKAESITENALQTIKAP